MDSMKCSVVILFLFIGYTFAGGKKPNPTITFKVRDDSGHTVTGAMVNASTFKEWIPGEGGGKDIYTEVEGFTDTNGVVSLTLPVQRGLVKYRVVPENEYIDGNMKIKIGEKLYYRDYGGSFKLNRLDEGLWEPSDLKIEIQLKEVINPIPMYARFLRSRDFKIPAYNKPLEYDLIAADWLPPYGNGHIVDIIFELNCKLGGVTESGILKYDAELIVAFPNDGDGIVEVLDHPRQGSALSLPRFAPINGYESQWVSKTYIHETDFYGEYKENQNFIFRVRTRKDNEGEIINSLYGKIIGPIYYEVRSKGASMQMKYYLNPTPNDRNLEFDPHRNLFRGQRVREP